MARSRPSGEGAGHHGGTAAQLARHQGQPEAQHHGAVGMARRQASRGSTGRGTRSWRSGRTTRRPRPGGSAVPGGPGPGRRWRRGAARPRTRSPAPKQHQPGEVDDDGQPGVGGMGRWCPAVARGVEDEPVPMEEGGEVRPVGRGHRRRGQGGARPCRRAPSAPNRSCAARRRPGPGPRGGGEHRGARRTPGTTRAPRRSSDWRPRGTGGPPGRARGAGGGVATGPTARRRGVGGRRPPHAVPPPLPAAAGGIWVPAGGRAGRPRVQGALPGRTASWPTAVARAAMWSSTVEHPADMVLMVNGWPRPGARPPRRARPARGRPAPAAPDPPPR